MPHPAQLSVGLISRRTNYQIFERVTYGIRTLFHAHRGRTISPVGRSLLEKRAGHCVRHAHRHRHESCYASTSVDAGKHAPTTRLHLIGSRLARHGRNHRARSYTLFHPTMDRGNSYELFQPIQQHAQRVLLLRSRKSLYSQACSVGLAPIACSFHCVPWYTVKRSITGYELRVSTVGFTFLQGIKVTRSRLFCPLKTRSISLAYAGWRRLI